MLPAMKAGRAGSLPTVTCVSGSRAVVPEEGERELTLRRALLSDTAPSVRCAESGAANRAPPQSTRAACGTSSGRPGRRAAGTWRHSRRAPGADAASEYLDTRVSHMATAAARLRRRTHRRRDHGAAWRIAKVAQERRRIGLDVGKLELVVVLRRPVDGAEKELRLATHTHTHIPPPSRKGPGIPVSAGILRNRSRPPSAAHIGIDFGGRRRAREDFLGPPSPKISMPMGERRPQASAPFMRPADLVGQLGQALDDVVQGEVFGVRRRVRRAHARHGRHAVRLKQAHAPRQRAAPATRTATKVRSLGHSARCDVRGR